MGTAVVSTTIGAEGIGAEPGREILIADDPAAFAAACARILDEDGLAARLGAAGRALVEARYSWTAAGAGLERFVGEIVEGRPGAAPGQAGGGATSTTTSSRDPGGRHDDGHAPVTTESLAVTVSANAMKILYWA